MPSNLVQFLVHSVTAPEGDILSERESAVTWLRAQCLLPGEADITNSEYSALLRLRDALVDVHTARAGGRPDSEAAARLSRALADGRLVTTVTATGQAKLASSARAPYSSVVAAIAIAVAEEGV